MYLPTLTQVVCNQEYELSGIEFLVIITMLHGRGDQMKTVTNLFNKSRFGGKAIGIAA